jgi:uncharacterized GH25 family protein
MKIKTLSLLLATSTAALAISAQAHSPYLKPNTFTPEARRDHVTVEASFAEGDLKPDVAMKSDSFSVTGPDGKTTPLVPVATLKDLTALEVPTVANGTYRISSGVRIGRVAKAVVRNGQLEFIEPGTPPKAGETTVDVQSITRADVYVSKAKPTPEAVAAPLEGVAIQPVTGPNDAYAGEAFAFRVTQDGKPLKGEAVTIITDGQNYQSSKVADIELKANDKGEVSFTPKTAGVYLIQTRVRRAAADKPGLWLSATATLTLEVLP